MTITHNGSGVVEEIVDITPAMAAEWLLLNTHNRPIRRAAVATYAADMAAEPSRWRYTGDPIRFAVDSHGEQVLIDGQHRLMAIVRAKRTVRMKVIRGFTQEIQRFVDIGNKRILADQLGIEGYEHSKALSRLARRIHAWRATGSPNMRASSASQVALREVVIDPETGEVYPLVAAAAEYAHRHPKGLIPASGLGFLFWLLTPLDPVGAAEFLDRADDGAGLVKEPGTGLKDPVLAWRDRIIDQRSTGLKLNDHIAIGYGIIAWNLRVKGRRVQYLRAPSGGITAKNFPQPLRPAQRTEPADTE